MTELQFKSTLEQFAANAIDPFELVDLAWDSQIKSILTETVHRYKFTLPESVYTEFVHVLETVQVVYRDMGAIVLKFDVSDGEVFIKIAFYNFSYTDSHYGWQYGGFQFVTKVVTQVVTYEPIRTDLDDLPF